jgi:hypothetical protein
MRLPFEFAKPVAPTRVRPRPHPPSPRSIPAGVIPSDPGASARRSTHARRRAAERP